MTEKRNDTKEIIRQNYDVLFLRFLIYAVLSSFIIFYFLFLRINDPTPLTIWNKLFYCFLPFIIVMAIVLLLYLHIGFIHSHNTDMISSISIKALQTDGFKTVLDWKKGTSLNFNKLQAYVQFQHYKFQLELLQGDENVPNKIQIKPLTEKITSDNYWLPVVQSYTLTINEDDWKAISNEKLIAHFTDIADRLRKNNVPPEN